MPCYGLHAVESLPPRKPGKSARKRIVIVTNPLVRSLEYMGPVQIFDETKWFFDISGRTDLGYDVEFVTVEQGPIYERKGLTIQANIPYFALRGHVDTLIVQAVDELDQLLANRHFIDWVAKMSTRVNRIASICTGAFVLAEAGVLDGRHATTHWCAMDDFQRRYPKIDVEPDPIYVKDGHVYTSAGASSGMDLSIALVEEDYGTEFARRVAQGMVMYLRRPGNQAQFSVHLAPRFSIKSRMHKIRTYITNNLQADLRVEALADRFHMSARNFTRVFTKDVGMTPGQFVEQCRLEFARQCLEETDLPMGQVANRCGYSTTNGLRLAFDRNLGVSPREYRRRFSTSRRIAEGDI